MLELELHPAVPSDAGRLLALREAAASWLVDRGIRQWEPGEVGVEQVRAQAEAGEWFVHRPDDEIHGALRLLWSDPEVWGERTNDAAYIHGLVIDRRFAGDGLGGRLLDWAEQRARDAGRSVVRLDCVETNLRLRRYYRDRGFAEVGRRDFGDTWWPVTLLEKPIGD